MNNEILSAVSGFVSNLMETVYEIYRRLTTDKEMLIAGIGVVGTLAGTVLGWLLNSWSNRGKLSIYVCSWEDKFTHNEFGHMIASSSIEQTKSYSFSASFDAYNSSGETKIMRDIEIVFSDGKKDIWHGTPDDQNTMHRGNVLIHCDEVEPLNIPPKTVIKLNLRDGVWNTDGSLDFIWRSKCVYLQYKDEKNHRKRILIKKENYAEYFANHVQETRTNAQAQ